MRALFLLALLALVSPQSGSQAPGSSGSIEGYVVVAGSSRPVAGAAVFLGGPPSNRPVPDIKGVADASGHFSFKNVPPPLASYYRVGAEAPGFDRVFNEVPYKAGETLNNVVVTMMTGGNIRGRITGPSGAPVAGVSVFVYREAHIYRDPGRYLSPYRVASDGSGVLVSVNRFGTDADLGQPAEGGTLGFRNNQMLPVSVQTDTDGNYLLRHIPPESYVIGVEFPVGYVPNPNGFATSFYPGVMDSTKARPIVIEPETDVRGINFTVQKPARYKVSGTVENTNIRAVSGVVLHLRGADRKMAPSFYSSVSPDGHFDIRNVIPGSYELSVTNVSIPVDAPVEVRGNVGGVVLRLPKTTNLAGTLSVVLRSGVTGLPQPASFGLDSSGLIAVQLKAPGAFTIPSVSVGTHYLYPSAIPSGYLMKVRQGSHAVDDDLRIQVRDVSEPLAVVIRPSDFGEIIGTIKAMEGKTKLSQVLLVPDGPRSANPMQYSAARTKSDGSFKLDTIVPGAYKLFAWEYGRVLGLDPYMNPSVLAAYEKYSQKVVVPPDGKLRIEASLIPR